MRSSQILVAALPYNTAWGSVLAHPPPPPRPLDERSQVCCKALFSSLLGHLLKELEAFVSLLLGHMLEKDVARSAPAPLYTHAQYCQEGPLAPTDVYTNAPQTATAGL